MSDINTDWTSPCLAPFLNILVAVFCNMVRNPEALLILDLGDAWDHAWSARSVVVVLSYFCAYVFVYA